MNTFTEFCSDQAMRLAKAVVQERAFAAKRLNHASRLWHDRMAGLHEDRVIELAKRIFEHQSKENVK